MNNEEEFECFYCYKKCNSSFMRNQHISYGHKSLIEFQTSKIYRNLLKELKELRIEVDKLKNEIYEKNKE